MVRSPNVAVVGGGIAGLAAAFDLVERGARVTLAEAEERFGGKIATTRTEDGLVVDAGPESLLSTKPAVLDLCERLGLASRLVDARREDQRTFVWSRGRLRPLPAGLVLGSPSRAGGLVRAGLVSPPGAARMLFDLAVPPRSERADESIASFFTRRLGREAHERVVEPLLAGIHAGDASRLSLAATFPRFADMEREHGGLVRASLANRRVSRSSPEPRAPNRTPFVSFAGGMGELVEALVSVLSDRGADLKAGQRVAELRPGPRGSGYRLTLEPAGALDVDGVILATPAYVTARLLQELAPVAAGMAESIPYASTATVSLAYRIADLDRVPQGYGFVVPRVERRHLIAVTMSSNKWPGRAPAAQLLVRAYVGGMGRDDVLAGDDEQLVTLVRDELRTLAGISAAPVHREVHRFPQGMPQYVVGHRDRVARLRAELAAWPGLAVTGAAYGGVGIPDCIADATATATGVLAELATR
jgi:oxygen-dependent protoporphyrinogen oxidase